MFRSRSGSAASVRTVQRVFDHAGAGRPRQGRFQPFRCTGEQPAAHGFQRGREQDGSEGGQGQEDQRVGTAAGQHAVHDLHGMQRQRQCQHIENATETRGGDQGRAASPGGGLQRSVGGSVGHQVISMGSCLPEMRR